MSHALSLRGFTYPIMNRYQSNKNKYDQVAIGLSAFTNVLWRSDAEYNG